MNILLLLVPLSLLLVGVAAWAFAWAVRRGQFDDLDTPALDVLRDDRNDLQIDGLPQAAQQAVVAGGVTGRDRVAAPASPGPADASAGQPAPGKDPHAD